MILKGKVLLKLFRKNGVTAAVVARELGMSFAEFAHVLRGSVPLGMEESRLMLSMFGAEDMTAAINWEALRVRCPI